MLTLRHRGLLQFVDYNIFYQGLPTLQSFIIDRHALTCLVSLPHLFQVVVGPGNTVVPIVPEGIPELTLIASAMVQISTLAQNLIEKLNKFPSSWEDLSFLLL